MAGFFNASKFISILGGKKTSGAGKIEMGTLKIFLRKTKMVVKAITIKIATKYFCLFPFSEKLIDILVRIKFYRDAKRKSRIAF